MNNNHNQTTAVNVRVNISEQKPELNIDVG